MPVKTMVSGSGISAAVAAAAVAGCPAIQRLNIPIAPIDVESDLVPHDGKLRPYHRWHDLVLVGPYDD